MMYIGENILPDLYDNQPTLRGMTFDYFVLACRTANVINGHKIIQPF